MAETKTFDAGNLFSVKGFVALVTGGGSGIGLMAAQALAANGAKVYITGRRVEALEKAAEEHRPPAGSAGELIPLGPCDVTKKADLEKLADEVGRREKFLHLLVCNAGVPGTKAEPEGDDAEDLRARLWARERFEDWRATFDVDVSSVYFTTVAFLPLLQAGVEPRGPLPAFAPGVITTSSMSGMMRHAQGHFSYNAAKAATIQLTKLMSTEFQDLRVRVNSIAPGYFPSEMTAHGDSDERQKSHLPDEQVRGKGHVPLQRPGREEEMGMAVLFLAKNQYVNGEILKVDGGVMNVLAG